MAGSRTGTGTTTTYTFAWTGAKLDAIADAAARQIWTMRNIDQPISGYETLSIQQKVDLLDRYIAENLTSLASAYKRDTDMQAAQVAADTFSKANYGLG